MTARTLTELMAQNRDADRAIVHHAGENQSRRVSYGELYQRALGLLSHLQQLGARPGDHLILLLNNNEAFLDGFWAAVLGGVVPVPVAVASATSTGASCCASRTSWDSLTSSRTARRWSASASSCSSPATRNWLASSPRCGRGPSWSKT